MTDAGKNTLQKSYSFDNVSFSALTTADPKDVGAVQKSIQTLSSEMTADLAKFTADELAAIVKRAGPETLVQAGAIEKLKGLAAENNTKANAYITITSLIQAVGTTVEVMNLQTEACCIWSFIA
jgi:predicted Zn-dependent peptidase